ncbi:unnamed protein product [Penicillium nalgiovense]|nr:unnamed protein product [Penicillium nalgiovense]
MSLKIVAVKEDVGFNRPRLRNVSFNTSNQVVYIVDQQTRQFLSRCLCEDVYAKTSVDVRTQCTRARATASCGLFIPGLDHQKIEPLGAHQSGPDNPALPSVQSHGLHTIPSPVVLNNAACPRWKIANQDSESTTGCGHPRGGRTACSIASRLPPSSPPPSHYCGVQNLWHRDTWIHHGSAMFIASGFVTRVYCLNKLSCAPQRGFFEASQIAMSLNATWHSW